MRPRAPKVIQRTGSSRLQTAVWNSFTVILQVGNTVNVMKFCLAGLLALVLLTEIKKGFIFGGSSSSGASTKEGGHPQAKSHPVSSKFAQPDIGSTVNHGTPALKGFIFGGSSSSEASTKEGGHPQAKSHPVSSKFAQPDIGSTINHGTPVLSSTLNQSAASGITYSDSDIAIATTPAPNQICCTSKNRRRACACDPEDCPLSLEKAYDALQAQKRRAEEILEKTNSRRVIPSIGQAGGEFHPKSRSGTALYWAVSGSCIHRIY